METEVLKEFKKHSIFRLKEGLRMVQKAMELVSDDQLWKLPIEGGDDLGQPAITLFWKYETIHHRFIRETSRFKKTR